MILVALGAAAASAVTDWWAVATGRARVEALAKPLVMICLITAAVLIDADPASARPWIVAGLIAGLFGDVFLLPQVDKFLAGLGAFLIGHGLYVIGLVQIDGSWMWLIVGIACGIAMLATIGRSIILAVGSTSYAVPVTIYIAAVAALVVAGVATGRWPLALGAAAFAFSDGLLGADKFVSPAPQRRVWIHVLYQLGQAGLVIGLATTFA